MTGSVSKVYPSGAITTYVEAPNAKRGYRKAIPFPNSVTGKMGLVNVSSRTSNVSTRCRQGHTGVTKLAKRTVREAIHVLGERVGNSNLVIQTVTIPSLAPREMKRLYRGWSSIQKDYLKRLKRFLAKKAVALKW